MMKVLESISTELVAWNVADQVSAEQMPQGPTYGDLRWREVARFEEHESAIDVYLQLWTRRRSRVAWTDDSWRFAQVTNGELREELAVVSLLLGGIEEDETAAEEYRNAASNGNWLEADEGLVRLTQMLRECRKEKAKWARAEGIVAGHLRARIGHAQGIRGLVSWVSSEGSNVDLRRLRFEEPEVFARYSSTRISRRLQLVQ